MLSLRGWHQRFLQQASWTKQTRKYLLAKTGLSTSDKILEIGCGTGAVLQEFSDHQYLFGLDLDPERLDYAKNENQDAKLIAGDAIKTPFSEEIFDIVFCHYFLLWVNDPVAAIKESLRILKPDGYFIAMAEPDYGGRIDFPSKFENFSSLQTSSLQKQGADPYLGRKLKSFINLAGLSNVETGVIGADWGNNQEEQDFETEWKIVESDLGKTLTDKELKELKQMEYNSIKKRERITFVPTFFSIGRK